MFDFLLSGEWWMETLAFTIITAGAAIASAIITSAASTKKVDKDLSVHDERSSSRKADLSNEHAALSKEHATLSLEFGRVSQIVSFLRDDRLKESARREAMKGQTLDAQKALDVLDASLNRMMALESQLADVRKELDDTRRELDALQKENDHLRRELAQHQEQEAEEEPEL